MHSRRLGRTTSGARVTLVTALLVLAAVCPAQALIYPGYAGWGTGDFAVPAQFGIGMGTAARALDTHDVYDSLAYVSNSGWTGGSYHVAGMDGWDGSTGFYYEDVGAYMQPGETKTWLLYIWAVPTAAPSDLTLRWGSGMYSDPSVSAQLECVQKPAGVVGGPSVGTIWTSPPTMTLPFYTTSNGLTGYEYKFTLSMVPEHSSILALVGGLAGLGGFVLRRRGKQC